MQSKNITTKIQRRLPLPAFVLLAFIAAQTLSGPGEDYAQRSYPTSARARRRTARPPT
jgi:hypothetical protein